MTASLFCMGASCQDQRTDASAALISAFQGSCVTSGQWTQAALAQTNAIVSVLEELKATDPCKPYISTLSSIQGLSQQINSLLTSQSYADYRTSEETLQELALSLQSADSGGAAAKALSDAVIKQQIDLAQKRAAYDTADSVTQQNQYATSTQQFATMMGGILQATQGGLSACLQQSPAAALELASSFLSIGGSFVSPIFGAGTQMVGQLFNIAVEYIRNSTTDQAIYDLYSSEMPVALSCGLESMSQLYCDADDAASLLSLQAQSYPTPSQPPEPIWQGLDLEGRRLPWLEKWLESVKNGVLPTDPSEAYKQNAIWTTLHELDDYYRMVYAELADQGSVYNSTTDPAQKQQVLVNTIVTVAGTLVSPISPGSAATSSTGVPTDPNSPFALKSSDPLDFACWLVWGPNTTDCKKADPSHPHYQLEDYIREVLLTAAPQADFSLLNTNWIALYNATDQLVQLQFAHTVTSDPDSLLASAREKKSPDANSARDVLGMIQNFLTTLLQEDDKSNPQLAPVVIQTQDLVGQAIAALDGTDTACTSNPASDDCKAAQLGRIEQIFEIFQLDKSLQFFLDRIGDFVEWDLEFKLERGELPSDSTQILVSAGQDIRDRVLASGINNLELVSQDLNQARANLSQSLVTFRQFFASSIGKSVTSLAQQAKAAGEPTTGPNRPFGQVLGQLCTLVLATGTDWPANVPWDICSSAVLSSVYPDPKGELSINVGKLSQQLKGVPLQQRMCAFHRFLRASRIAEVLNDESGAPTPLPTPLPTTSLSSLPTPNPPTHGFTMDRATVYDFVVGKH